MTTETVEPLGYVLAPPRRPHEPGHPKVEMWLAETPTGKHFDPEQVLLSVITEGHLDTIEIEHPWSGERTLRLAPGQLIVIDRINKHLNGFTFGGDISIETSADYTQVRLASPAPIMVGSNEHPEIILLIEEANILLARRRAFWAETPEELEKRLNQVDPLTLYAAFLVSIEANIEQLPPSEDETLLKAQHIIRQELHEVGRVLPGFELSLEILC